MTELPINKILQGNNLDILKTFPDDCIDTIITSPPYFNLRNYSTNPQIWDGKQNCEHKFNLTNKKDPMDRKGHGYHDREDGLSGNKIDYKTYEVGYCEKCNAWK